MSRAPLMLDHTHTYTHAHTQAHSQVFVFVQNASLFASTIYSSTIWISLLLQLFTLYVFFLLLLLLLLLFVVKINLLLLVQRFFSFSCVWEMSHLFSLIYTLNEIFTIFGFVVASFVVQTCNSRANITWPFFIFVAFALQIMCNVDVRSCCNDAEMVMTNSNAFEVRCHFKYGGHKLNLCTRFKHTPQAPQVLLLLLLILPPKTECSTQKHLSAPAQVERESQLCMAITFAIVLHSINGIFMWHSRFLARYRKKTQTHEMKTHFCLSFTLLFFFDQFKCNNLKPVSFSFESCLSVSLCACVCVCVNFIFIRRYFVQSVDLEYSKCTPLVR